MSWCVQPCATCAHPDATPVHVLVVANRAPGLLAHVAAASAGSGWFPDVHVVVYVATSTQLENLANLLRFEGDLHGLAVHEVEDPGDPSRLVALGISPAPREATRGYVEHLSRLTD